jgi:acetyl esterase/lipase
MRRTAGACCLVVVLGGTACESASYDVEENVSYDSTLGYHGTVDFYEPRSDSGRANRPAVLAIHGGAWRGGDKAWGEQFAAELCPFGYVVFSINYLQALRSRWRHMACPVCTA